MGRGSTQNLNVKNEPKVTVLMSVYNGERYLNEAIDSILAQTFTDFEFLIIDDASTDTTYDILRSYEDSRIKIAINKKNQGLTKSLNEGLGMARGKYIARMDADDVSMPERLEKQVKFLEDHSKIAVVGTAIQYIDKNGKKMGVLIPTSKPKYHDFLKGNQLVHGSIMIRKEIMDEYSGYNELFKQCQDYALWLQISKKYMLYNIPDLLYKLRKHEKSVSYSSDESIFYRILAVRIAESTISETLIEKIQKSGIRYLAKYFNRSEFVYYHRIIADQYRFFGDLKSARREYWKIFHLEPWNILNIANIIRFYLGKHVIYVTERLYVSFKNYMYRMQ